MDIYKATSNNGNVPKTIQNVQTAMGTYDYQVRISRSACFVYLQAFADGF